MLLQATLQRKPLIRSVAPKRGRGWIALVFFLTLAFRYAELYQFRDFNSDKARQLHGAYNLLQGRGLTYESVDLNTFAVESKPNIDWPPAYSYMAAAISKLSGSDLYSASWTLDVLALALVWGALLLLTQRLRFTVLQTVVAFLLFGFSKASFGGLYSNDILGTGLFLLSCALNVWALQTPSTARRPVLLFGMQALLIIAMCLLKYSLMPAFASLAISALTFAWVSEKKHLKTGVLLAAQVLLGLGLLYAYNKTHANQATALAERHGSESGLHFDNLGMHTPFLVNGLFYLEGLRQKLNFRFYEDLVRLINLAIVGWVLVRIGLRIKARTADYFSHLVFWTTLSVCGFLAGLSVLFPADINGRHTWTYVKELRYFTPVYFLVALYLIGQLRPVKPRSLFASFALLFVAAATVFGIALSGYYRLSGNTASSFENSFGNVVRVREFVQRNRTADTYFTSLSGREEVDAGVTSLVATDGTKVCMSYYGYFPGSILSPLFTKGQTVPSSKRIIIFLDQNLRVLDSLNPALRYQVHKNNKAEHFLIVN